MSKSTRNTVPAQATPAALLAKHTDTIALLATSVHGMKQASDTITSAKEVQAKCMESIRLCIKALRADKVKLGDARTCGFTKAMSDTFYSLGLVKGTVNNYLVDVKRAVNLGESFVLNSARAKADAKKKEAAKTAALEAAKTGPATLVPPAGETTQGANVKVHTNDTIADIQDRDSSTGAPVQVAPNASKHEQAKAICAAVKPMLGELFLLAGAINMKSNQAALAAIAEELSRIESEIVDAMKR